MNIDVVRNLIMNFFKSRMKRIISIIALYILLICLMPLFGILIQKINTMNIADTMDAFIKFFDIVSIYNSTLVQIGIIILLILSMYLMLFYNYKAKKFIYFIGYLLFIIISITRMINGKILQYAYLEKLNPSNYIESNIINVDNMRYNTLYSTSKINSMDKIIKVLFDDQSSLFITYNKRDYQKEDIQKYIDDMLYNGFKKRQENEIIIYEKDKYCFTSIEKEKNYVFVYGKC